MRIEPSGGAGFRLGRGQVLEVSTPTGGQIADLFCVRAADTEDSFSAPRTLDYADRVFVTRGDILYSVNSTRLMEIVEDSAGRHDLLMPPCSLKMFQLVAGNDEYHPSCHENLSRALEEFGVTPWRIGCSLNLFMNVRVSEDGGVRIEKSQSIPGAFVRLKALEDLFVGLTACAHEETNGGVLKAVDFRLIDIG